MIGIGKRPGVAEALRRVLGQGTGNDAIEACGQVTAPLAERRNGSVQMLLGDFVRCVAHKYWRAGQHMEKDRPKRVHIGVGTDRLTEQLLWRVHFAPHVEQICLRVLSIQDEQADYAKVRNGHLPIEPDENAVNRDAAMQHRMLVGVFQSSGDLIQVATDC